MDPSVYRSPKRKRNFYEDSVAIIETSGFGRSFTRRASDAESTGGDKSPRTSVTRKFQKLDLRNASNSRIPFRETKPESRKETDDSFTYDADQMNMELHESHREGMFTFKAGQSSPMNVSQPTSEQTSPSSSQSKQLNTHSSPQIHEFQGQAGQGPPSPHHRRSKSPPLPKSKRSESPPPTSSSTDAESEFWWSSSEITGWDPSDPDEDNYGVNGVGYQKTAAVAYSLSQKRKQQIAEYRNREAREARQRRSENRRSAFRTGGSRKGSPTAATVISGPSSRPGSSSMMMMEESIGRSEPGVGMGNVTGGGNVRCVRFEVG